MSEVDPLVDANRRFERGDFRGAAAAYEEFLTSSPEQVEILFKLAQSYHELDQGPQFEKAMRRLLALNPRRPEAFVLRGRRLFRRHRFVDRR